MANFIAPSELQPCTECGQELIYIKAGKDYEGYYRCENKCGKPLIKIFENNLKQFLKPKTMTTDNPFLPEDYSIPKPPSDYMKLEDGLNSIRILSSAITGYEYWNTDNKPVRSKICWDELPEDIKPDKQGKYTIKHFWAFVVWNYSLNRVQILQLTQSTIQKQIKALVSNPKWGNPKMYDIAITRSEESNGITSYKVSLLLEKYLKKLVMLSIKRKLILKLFTMVVIPLKLLNNLFIFLLLKCKNSSLSMETKNLKL